MVRSSLFHNNTDSEVDMREGTGGCEEDPDRKCWERGSAGGDLPAHVIQTTGPYSVLYTESSDQSGLEQDSWRQGLTYSS